METRKINEVTPEGFTGSGIFSKLQEFDVPWKLLDIAGSLDAEYYGNISGEKMTSPAVDRLLDSTNTLPDSALTTLAGVVYNVFGKNWSKLWATLLAEYDPIQNYSMVETMTDDETVIDYGHTRARTDNLSHGKTGTETETPNITVDTDSLLYGFNSSSPVPTDERQQRSTGTSTTTYGTTETDTGTVSEIEGGQDTHTRSYELTRRGNIGVTTSQQMLESERTLWMWNYFIAVVFPDVDRVLTIQTY